MDPLTALGLFNAAMQIAAYFVDLARRGGATPEQIAEARAKALEHFDQVAEALEKEEPPAA